MVLELPRMSGSEGGVEESAGGAGTHADEAAVAVIQGDFADVGEVDDCVGGVGSVSAGAVSDGEELSAGI